MKVTYFILCKHLRGLFRYKAKLLDSEISLLEEYLNVLVHTKSIKFLMQGFRKIDLHTNIFKVFRESDTTGLSVRLNREYFILGVGILVH